MKIPFNNLINKCSGPIALTHPLNSAVKTGFVLMSVYDDKSQKILTIGNRSYMRIDNGGMEQSDRPFIKSFNYSLQDGCQVEIVVIDVSGGQFRSFYESAVSQPYCKGTEVNLIEIDFGWIYTDCNNKVSKYSLSDVGSVTYILASGDDAAVPPVGKDRKRNSYLKCMIKKIDVEIDSGFWVYKLTLINLSEGSEQNSVNKTKDDQKTGTEDYRQRAMDAFNGQLKNCKLKVRGADENNNNNKPNDAAGMYKIEQKPFVVGPNGNFIFSSVMKQVSFKISDGGWRGPPSIYNANNMHNYDSIRNYMNSFTTINNKGTVFVTDAKANKAYLYIVEDPRMTEDEIKAACSKNQIPTYVVNAGDGTPVISFNPKLEIIPVEAIDTASSTVDSGQGQSKQEFDDNIKRGIETFYATPSDNFNFRAPRVMKKKELFAVKQNSAATDIFETRHPIEADLVIIGDPSFSSIVSVLATYIHIIYLNPYSVGSDGKSCEWDNSFAESDGLRSYLVGSRVNNYLSRNDYMIKGCTHTIDENGNYTTTLRVIGTVKK